MRLASRRDGSRDGALSVVDPTGQHFCDATDIAPSLQAALDDWQTRAPLLARRSEELASGRLTGTAIEEAEFEAPLPRAYEWIDGSAYVEHILLARKARNAAPPANLLTEPLVYQGGSGTLMGPRDAVPLLDAAAGLDFEGELCAVLLDTPRGTTRDAAGRYIALLTLANDWTLRHRVPAELAKGFGFFTSKPATSFSPFAVTPNELAGAWREGRVHLKLRSTLNGELIGDVDAGPEMHFSFFDLIEHICQTRSFTAGTLLGSGTVSNRAPERGVSCLAERRMRELLQGGETRTPFLRVGDHIRLEMQDTDGRNLFGAIEQRVVSPSPVHTGFPKPVRRME